MKRAMLTGFLFCSLWALAQTVNAFIVQGNDWYKLSQWQKAEGAYRQALQKEPANATALFNLANALHQQQKYDEATQLLERLGPTAPPTIKPAAYYNQGVAFSKQKELEKSIAAYKEALRGQPNDQQARENLQKALHELKQQQQQEKDKDKSSGGGGMSQKEAEQKLKQLQEKEKKLQERLQQKGQQGTGGAKDW